MSRASRIGLQAGVVPRLAVFHAAGLLGACTPGAREAPTSNAVAPAGASRPGASPPAVPSSPPGSASAAPANTTRPPDEPTVAFEDFLAPVTPESLAASLGDWVWLIGTELRPVAMTIFGDVLLIDSGNRLHLLDTAFGVVEVVATSNDQFRTRLQEPLFQSAVLRLELARAVLGVPVPDASADGRPASGPLGPGQVFGFRIPLILGGPTTSGNVIRVSATTALAMSGIVARQLQSVPVGQPVAMEFRNFPGQGARGPTSGPPAFVRTARDRQSLAVRPSGPPR